MRRKAAWLTAPAVLLSLLAGAAPAHAEGRDWTGTYAQEIYVASGLNGIAPGTTLGQFRGHVVVLKFFFTGCPTCRASLPGFQDLYRTYSPRGVQFIAVAYDSREAVTSLMAGQGYDFPVAIDPDGITPKRYGVFSYPTNYIIGADGMVKAYDSLSSWVIDRELASAAPVRNANVDELGAVPAVLAAVKDAAQRNDYGAVLRIVEAHRDATRDSADVVAAANRIREICRQRWTRRVERIQARWSSGDRQGAYADALRFAQDFEGTSFHASNEKWNAALAADLQGPVVVGAAR